MTVPSFQSPTSGQIPTLAELEALIQRDRQRKLLLALPVAGLIGAAVAFQAPWVLAVAATAVVGGRALHQHR
jgi:hypothetical protein